MMTAEQVELSKKLLHTQQLLLSLQNDNRLLFFAVSGLIRRLDRLESVLDAMCIARGVKDG